MRDVFSAVAILAVALVLAACTVGGQRNGVQETPTPTPGAKPTGEPFLVPCDEPARPSGFPVIETCWRATQEMTIDDVILTQATGPRGPTVDQREMRVLEEYAAEFGGVALWEAVSPYNHGATIAGEVTDGLVAALAALPPAPTPTPDAWAEGLLAQARAALAGLRSYQYDLVNADEQYPHSLFPPPVRTGAWAAPDRWLFTYDGMDVMRMIGGQMWSRQISDGPDAPWYAGPSPFPFPLLAPDRPLQYMTDPFLLGEETLDGEPVYRLAGRYRPDAGLGLEPTREIDPLHVELFIRRSDHLPVRLVIVDAYRSVQGSSPGGTLVPSPTRPEDAMTYHYHSFNEPIVIEPPERWETGPLPTATPGQAFRAAIGFRPEPHELTEAQWAELAAAVRELLHNAGHAAASVRLLDNMVWVDAPYSREQAATLIHLVREGPLPYPMELRAEAYSASGSP